MNYSIMSTVFEKIKKILEKEEACIVSKNGNPKYVAMTWNKYSQIADELKELRQLRETVAAMPPEGVDHPQEDEEFDVDINSIPV